MPPGEHTVTAKPNNRIDKIHLLCHGGSPARDSDQLSAIGCTFTVIPALRYHGPALASFLRAVCVWGPAMEKIRPRPTELVKLTRWVEEKPCVNICDHFIGQRLSRPGWISTSARIITPIFRGNDPDLISSPKAF